MSCALASGNATATMCGQGEMHALAVAKATCSQALVQQASQSALEQLCEQATHTCRQWYPSL